MNVYLVYPDVSSFHGLPYHPGLASLAAMLEHHGHVVKVGYFTSVDQFPDLVKEVVDFQPGVIGFTAVETQYEYVQALAGLIKEKHPCVTVVGGTYITLAPEAILEPASSSLDCGMVGESEHALLNLVEKVQKGEDYHGVNNLCYRHPENGRLVTNPLYPQIMDLSSIPHPSTEAFDYQKIIDEHNLVLFHFNRGCPYGCTYCAVRSLAEQYDAVGPKLMRLRTVDSAIEEIKLTLEKYRVPSGALLMFSDDLLVVNKKWLYDFCDRYGKEIGRPFWCTSRSNLVSPEMFDRLRSAGCYKTMMSIESGNDFIRNEVMKRGISRKVMFNSFEWANQYGIKTNGTCIVGVPFETPETVEDSIATVAQLGVSDHGINIFYPYAGTPLRKICEENGFMPNKRTENVHERFESILNLPTISKKEILHYFDHWEGLVFSHKPKRMQVGRAVRKFYIQAREKVPGGRKIHNLIDGHMFTKKIKDSVLRATGYG